MFVACKTLCYSKSSHATRRGRDMYITYPTIKKGKKGVIVVRLVHCYRTKKAGYPITEIVKVVGQSNKPEVVLRLRERAAELLDQYNKGLITFDKLKKHEKKKTIKFYDYKGNDVINLGCNDIFGATYKSLGFEALLQSGRNNKALNEILKQLVLARLYDPLSKRKSCKLISEKFKKNMSYKKIFLMMDHISRNEEELKKKFFASLLGDRKDLKLLLFDVTTLYFESTHKDDLRQFGFSKDGKSKEVQVVLTVISDSEGMPLAYDIFPGSTAEIKTLVPVIKQFVKNHHIKKICLTADRGMFSEKNFRFLDALGEELGIKLEYVVACPLGKLSDSVRSSILEYKKKCLSDQHESSFYECKHKGRRLIVSFCAQRSRRDAAKRTETLEKLMKITNSKGEIAPSYLKKKTGVHRYVKNTKSSGHAQIDREQIAADCLWDGLYGIYAQGEGDARELFLCHKNLWKIEEVFRINKHNLSMRPIFHWLSRRIRAHIFICFLAYATLKHTELTLKKAGLSCSPEDLRDALRDANVVYVKHKTRGLDDGYVLPLELPEKTKKIYEAFQVKYPVNPYFLKKLKKKSM